MKQLARLLIWLAIVEGGIGQERWQRAGLDTSAVHAVFLSGNFLFAGTADQGAFRSTNRGQSWTQINNGLTASFIKTFAMSGSLLFAGSNGGGIYVSTNNGDNWQPSSNGLTSAAVQSLATIGTTLFAGTNGAGVFRSTNDGASWSAVTNGLTNASILSLVASGTQLYAGTGTTSSEGGVYRSTNGGDNWTLLTGTTVRAVRSLSTNEFVRFLYAGCNGPGVFVSSDDGVTWIQRNNGLTNTSVRAVAVSSNIHTVTLLAGTNGAGVFASMSDGLSWSPSNDGLGNLSILTLKQLGGFVYAGTSAGLWCRAVPTNVKQTDSPPQRFLLGQNYPNPFNPSTTIRFELMVSGFVSLNVFDMLGNEVAALAKGELSAGKYERTFDGSNLASGMYFYRLTAGNSTQTKKLVLTK